MKIRAMTLDETGIGEAVMTLRGSSSPDDITAARDGDEVRFGVDCGNQMSVQIAVSVEQAAALAKLLQRAVEA